MLICVLHFAVGQFGHEKVIDIGNSSKDRHSSFAENLVQALSLLLLLLLLIVAAMQKKRQRC